MVALTLTGLISTNHYHKSSITSLHHIHSPISSPTRYGTLSATILDLFLGTPDIPITNSAVLYHAFSDHLPIHLQIKCAVPCPPLSLVSHRSFKHFSKSSFEDDLSSVPQSILNVFDDPDDKVEAFNILSTDVLNYHAPLKTIRVRKKILSVDHQDHPQRDRQT